MHVSTTFDTYCRYGNEQFNRKSDIFGLQIGTTHCRIAKAGHGEQGLWDVACGMLRVELVLHAFLAYTSRPHILVSINDFLYILLDKWSQYIIIQKLN